MGNEYVSTWATYIFWLTDGRSSRQTPIMNSHQATVTELRFHTCRYRLIEWQKSISLEILLHSISLIAGHIFLADYIGDSWVVRLCYSLYILFLAGLFSACDHPFSFSPFEIRIPEELRHTTGRNLKRIMALDSIRNDSIITIALLSDTHYHYNDLADAIEKINIQEETDFIIVTGDFTENGLQKEYEIFHHLMAKSNKPYVTVIGNHDHLSNGSEVYRQMFGAHNYSFTYGNTKFVMWDNVRWESNTTPDWNWFRETLRAPSGISERNEAVRHMIPFAHIPPFDGQMQDSALVYDELLHRQGIEVSIHGHKHEFSSSSLFSHGITYITVGTPQKRNFAQLVITRDRISVTKIEY